MVAPDTQLSDPARAILRTVIERKLARGGELLSLSEIREPERLVEPIKELLNQGLIEVSGLSGELTPDSALFATFGIVPSNEKYLRSLAKW